MDTKTGNLLWPAIGTPQVTAQPIDGDVRCEVAVLGAGMTGAFAACLLAGSGVDVVVIDRRGVAEGSTPASTGLVQYEIDRPLIALAGDVGLDAAQTAYRGCRKALDDLQNLTRVHQIECDLRWCGSLYLATEDRDADWFVREAAARQAIGIEVEPLSRRDLFDRFDIDRPAALHSLAAMEVDPYALTHGLFKAAEKLGARILQAEAILKSADAGGVRLDTVEGPTISARHLVVATGYEAPEQFAFVNRYCTLKSTYALASEPLEGVAPWPGRVLIWESGDPYFYARQTVDNRVIVGGEDEPIVDPDARDALIDEKAAAIVEKFRLLRPEITIIPEFRWAGTFAESPDGMPLIGQVPRYPRCHFALGYGGNGMTFGVMAAQIVRDVILGRANKLAGVFHFDR